LTCVFGELATELAIALSLPVWASLQASLDATT